MKLEATAPSTAGVLEHGNWLQAVKTNLTHMNTRSEGRVRQ